MSQFKAYTFYKIDGTTISLYGETPQNALDKAGYNLDYIAENIRDYREGLDDTSLNFINGEWRLNEESLSKTIALEMMQFNN